MRRVLQNLVNEQQPKCKNLALLFLNVIVKGVGSSLGSRYCTGMDFRIKEAEVVMTGDKMGDVAERSHLLNRMRSRPEDFEGLRKLCICAELLSAEVIELLRGLCKGLRELIVVSRCDDMVVDVGLLSTLVTQPYLGFVVRLRGVQDLKIIEHGRVLDNDVIVALASKWTEDKLRTIVEVMSYQARVGEDQAAALLKFKNLEVLDVPGIDVPLSLPPSLKVVKCTDVEYNAVSTVLRPGVAWEMSSQYADGDDDTVGFVLMLSSFSPDAENTDSIKATISSIRDAMQAAKKPQEPRMVLFITAVTTGRFLHAILEECERITLDVRVARALAEVMANSGICIHVRFMSLSLEAVSVLMNAMINRVIFEECRILRNA